MKFSTLSCIAAVCTTAALSGCVMAPVGMHRGHDYDGPAVYAAPPRVVYVAPTYAIPAPGYAWQHNGRNGWGWHHPSHGWHRGRR